MALTPALTRRSQRSLLEEGALHLQIFLQPLGSSQVRRAFLQVRRTFCRNGGGRTGRNFHLVSDKVKSPSRNIRNAFLRRTSSAIAALLRHATISIIWCFLCYQCSVAFANNRDRLQKPF